MIASPSDLDPLDVARERGRIAEALQGLQASGLVELTWLEGQTWRDLQHAMRGGPWHIFHFIGHGGFDPRSEEGVLALADEQGKLSLMTATQMGHLLADHRSLRLALLNACEGARGDQRDLFSSTAATLARRGIPAVLAMQYEITDKAAIECTRSFYEALADGMPVDAAVSEARKAISLGIANTLEWGTPVLYMRTPDGALFEVAKKSAARHRDAAARQKPHEAPAAQPASKIGALLCTYRGHDAQVQHLGWSPDGARVASVQRFDAVVHVWDTGVGARLLTYEGHTDSVNSVAWSPDGTRIASASDDGTVHIWEAETGKLLRAYSGHQGHVLVAAWSPDGKRIASSAQDDMVHIWGAASGALITSWPGKAPLAWSPDGTRIVCRNAGATARVYDAASGEALFALDLPGEFYALAWSRDGSLIASAGEGGTIHLWKPAGGGQRSFAESEDVVLALAWSADSKRLASGGYDGFVHIWDASTLQKLFTYSGHEADTVITDLAWSTDGTRIASASWDMTVHIWQAE